MSDKMAFEPKVKNRKSSIKKILLIVLLLPLFILIGLGILGAIITGGEPTKDKKQAAKQTQAATPQEVNIGQTVSDAGFNFLVNSIKCGEKQIKTSGLAYYYSDAQGQFCRLNITITNTGNTTNSIGVSNQYTFNAQGQRYDYAGGATANAANTYAGSPLNGDINPGNSITGDIVFDVPVGITLTVAELHGGYDSLGVRINLQ